MVLPPRAVAAFAILPSVLPIPETSSDPDDSDAVASTAHILAATSGTVLDTAS